MTFKDTRAYLFFRLSILMVSAEHHSMAIVPSDDQPQLMGYREFLDLLEIASGKTKSLSHLIFFFGHIWESALQRRTTCLSHVQTMQGVEEEEIWRKEYQESVGMSRACEDFFFWLRAVANRSENILEDENLIELSQTELGLAGAMYAKIMDLPHIRLKVEDLPERFLKLQ